MGAESKTGPVFITGNMQKYPAGYGSPVNDPNQDRGPSMVFDGWFLGDVRFPLPKDKIEGFTGEVPGHALMSNVLNVDAIPAAYSASNIAAAQSVAAGVPMALAAALATGITPNIPVRTQTQGTFGLNGGPVVTAIALDFGFAFGNVTAGQAQVTVADSTQFIAGEPLVIGGVGNAGGTLPLLTACASIVDATHITLAPGALPLGTNAAAPIGTGNYWGPSPAGFPGQPQGLPFPDAALPYVAQGPGLILDPRQSLTRAVGITGTSGAAGGSFSVVGIDLFDVLVHETIVQAGGTATTFGNKTYKYIISVTPQFTDAGHNYTVGTSDVFGAAVRGDRYEYQDIFWAGLVNVNVQANSGWTAADTTNPATATTGDVRGTFQSGTNGNGGGETGGSASNGAISNLAMSGRRLTWFSDIALVNLYAADQSNPAPIYGVNQF